MVNGNVTNFRITHNVVHDNNNIGIDIAVTGTGEFQMQFNMTNAPAWMPIIFAGTGARVIRDAVRESPTTTAEWKSSISFRNKGQ